MSRASVIIRSEADRDLIRTWATNSRLGTRVTFQTSTRSLDQNNLFWSRLTDIARQKKWNGGFLSAQDWKTLFMDALNREARLVPSLDGKGIVNLGRSSSRLTKDEFSDLLTMIGAFADEHGIVLTDQPPVIEHV